MLSLIAAINETLGEGRSLTFSKNPYCCFDLSLPEAQYIGMTLAKYICGAGHYSCSINWDMQVLGNKDQLIADGLGRLSKLVHEKGLGERQDQGMSLEVVFSEVMNIFTKRARKDGVSREELIKDVTYKELISTIGAVFLQKGEPQNARSKTTTD